MIVIQGRCCSYLCEQVEEGAKGLELGALDARLHGDLVTQHVGQTRHQVLHVHLVLHRAIKAKDTTTCSTCKLLQIPAGI